MSKKKLKILVLGGLLLGSTNVYAANVQAVESPTQGTENSIGTESKAPGESNDADQRVTKDDVEGVRGEVAVLRDQLNRTLERNIANTQRALKIGGILQSRYTYPTYTTIPHSSASYPVNGFSLNSAILSLKGNLKKDYDEGRNIDYTVSFQAASPSSYNLQALDVFLQYSILQSLDIEKPTLYVQFGQQKKPFGLEPQTTEEKAPAINLATFAGVAGGKGLDLASRDIGIQLRGDLFPTVDLGYNYRNPLIEYAVGIFNGSGANALDTNSDKDFVGRVVLNAPVDYNSDFRGLAFGNSLYKGRRDITLTANGVTLKEKGNKIRYGQDISYVSSPVGFTAEYAVGKDDALTGSIANAVKASTQSRGYTVTLFYEWGEQFLKNYRNQSRNDDWWPKTYQPFLRFDSWDPNTAIAGDHTTVLTYGFNFFFAETTKLQLNYNVRNDRSQKVKQNDLLVQFQYGF